MGVFSTRIEQDSVGAPSKEQTTESAPLLANDKKESALSPTDTLENDVILKELHDSVEKELIQTVSRWSHRVIVFLPAAAAVLLYFNGQDNMYINPMVISLVASIAGFFPLHTQWNICLMVVVLMILKHSLSQGCSASLVPAVYGFLPCAFGFLFRTTRAVVVSTSMVLLAVLVIFAVDFSGNCATEAISKSQTTQIVADRLIPLLMMILGNSIVIIAIVKHTQKALLLHAKAAQSAAKLADVRRDVLHRVTHELRTPLNGIVGSVELLTTSDTMNESDMENALTIKSCLQNIVRICDDVLMAAKSRTDDKVRRETVFLVASCIDDVVDIFGAAAEQKGISLKLEFVGNTQAYVRGMEVELRQVLLNLVGNAMKFTVAGSITIRIKEQASQSLDAVRYIFEVEDTGIGIVGEDSNMLFEAFQQGEQDAVSRQHKGTGLGLTICKDYVELMGGTIHVDGSRDKGTSFNFALEFQKISSGESTGDIVIEKERRINVMIADSKKESAATCHSVVSSIAPSAVIKTSSSLTSLLSTISSEAVDQAPMSESRIAIVAWDSIDSIASLSRLKESGWIVLAYCNHKDFLSLTGNTDVVSYAFRRPLPLIRLGSAFRDALNSGTQTIRKSTIHKTNDTTETTKVKATLSDNVSIDNTNHARKTTSKARPSVELLPGSKVVVVDDTLVNVKVLVKMLSRTTAVPIVSCFDGQSAVELASSSDIGDKLLFLMDWHMPGVCGLSATNSLRRIAKERGGPSVFICMVTADIEGLYTEMDRRNMSYEGTVSKGELIQEGQQDDVSTSESEEEIANAMRLSRKLERENSGGFTVVDIVAEKPVTFSSIQAILSWFQEQVEETSTTEQLSTRYFKRLGLNHDELNDLPPLQRLQDICEAHLKMIPFENLSQHGVGEPVSLETDMLANKLLDRRRGGFCFELNGLLAELLLELGYKVVRVLAHVYKGDGRFLEEASHMVLMVTVDDDSTEENRTTYLVDVGFGEPSIHPLRYPCDTLQRTPEGMLSQFVRDGDDSVLEWLDGKTGAFVPRFKFKHADATVDEPGPALANFYENLMTVYHPESPFSQKIIVCSVDRSVKKTVAGNRLKITGPPRFDKDTVPVVQEIGDANAVRSMLETDFGIPMEETEGLTLSKSIESPSEMWMA